MSMSSISVPYLIDAEHLHSQRSLMSLFGKRKGLQIARVRVVCCCRYDSDVNVADRWNGTPLMAALRNGHLAIAKMLMSCEATLGDNADPALVEVRSRLLASEPCACICHGYYAQSTPGVHIWLLLVGCCLQAVAWLRTDQSCS